MDAEHAELLVKPPPPPIQNFQTLVAEPSPEHTHKDAADDMLMLGLMLYMQQGLVLEWLHPCLERDEKEEEEKGRRAKPKPTSND
jgi:hypothetical protein